VDGVEWMDRLGWGVEEWGLRGGEIGRSGRMDRLEWRGKDKVGVEREG
jgi:hypothetical protein